MDGFHYIKDAAIVTERVLHHVFDAMFYERVELEYIILKPNMILNGYESDVENDPSITAELTTRSFKRTIPSAVPMIAFLSGGQDDGVAVENLNAINKESNLPWDVSFSFGRELQKNALSLWANAKKQDAKNALLERANQCSLATQGELHGTINI